MALLDSTLISRNPLESLEAAIGARLRAALIRVARWRQYRTVRHELLEYAPHELAELGISEADIDLVAMTSARD